MKKGTIIGTSHFTGLDSAVSYYRAYGFSREDVIDKKNNGEINIDKPKTKDGETLVLLDGSRRYGIKITNP